MRRPPPRRDVPPAAWLALTVLLALSVPWWLPRTPEWEARVWAFPRWGAAVVAVSVALSLLLAWIYLRDWELSRPRRRRAGKRGGL